MESCAITGHRPNRFKWKYQEDSAGCKRLKKRLKDQFMLLYRQGVRRYYAGGALGVDMWASEILLTFKAQPEFCDLELFIVIPFDGYDNCWDTRNQLRMAAIRQEATDVITIRSDDSFSPSKNYRRRNQYMVNRSDCLLAVYDNDRSIRSGTGMTVHYAEQKRLPIILIHPDTAVVSQLRPQ